MMGQRFGTVRLAVRAPRVAVLMRAEEEWIFDARRVLGTVSRVWGGVGHIVVPWLSGEVHPALLDVARGHDPDYLTVVSRTFADWRAQDPEGCAAWAARQAFVLEAEDRAAAERSLLEQIADDPVDADGVSDEAVGRLAGVCSPYVGYDGAARAEWLHPRQPVAGPLTDVRELRPLFRAEEPLWQLDLSEVDPALALMIETRTGAYSSTDGLGDVLRVAVREEDLDALVSLAVAGDVGFTSWDLRNRFQQAVGAASVGHRDGPEEIRRRLGWTPLARSVTGLVELTSVDHIPQAVLVVGDSPDDYTLAVAHDRLSGRGTWLPTAMADPGHEHFARLRRAMSWLRRRREINNLSPSRLFVTSTTLDTDQLRQVADQLTDGDTSGTPHRVAAVQVAAPEEIPRRGRRSWADPGRYDARVGVPVTVDASGEVVMLTELDLPTPTAVDAEAVPGLRWEVDIDLVGHQLPARGAMGGSRLLATGDQSAFPGAQLRAGVGGVTVHSHSQGLVLAGSPLQLRLARPRLVLPGPADVVRSIVDAAGVTVQLSDAGRRAATASALWPDLPAMAADLRPPVRRLLDVFAAPKTNGPYKGGIAVHGQGYLSFALAARALGATRTETRSTLDRLLAKRVLRRGLLLDCARCDWKAFQPIDELAQVITCPRCRHRNELSQPRWRRPTHEPAWFYDLDQLVRDLLAANGDLPLLAADRIRQDHQAVLVAHELQLTDPGDPKPFAEIDICLIADGRVVVGEAKTANTISASQIDKLARAAAVLTADEVYLATAADQWTDPTITKLRAALTRAYEPLGRRPPPIHQLTGLRGTAPAGPEPRSPIQ